MRRLGTLTAAALLLAVSGTATAQAPTLRAQTPDGRTVVLEARESQGQRCLVLTVGDEAPARTSPCAPPPADAKADVTAVHVVYRATPQKLTIVHGLLSPETGILQLRFADGKLVDLRPEGEARAYLAVLRGRPAIASARAVGHDGRDAAAADLDPRYVKVKPRRGPVELDRLRDERGSRARFEAFTTPLLPPRELRRRAATCVSVGSRTATPQSNVEPGYGGGSACAFRRSQIVLEYAAGCAEPRRLLLFGLGPSEVRSYVLVTATGRRLRADTRRLPRVLRRPGRRAFIFQGPDPGRLNRLEAYGRGAERLASISLTAVGSGCISRVRS